MFNISDDDDGVDDDRNVFLKRHINEGNKTKALVLKGCPWKVTPDEIMDFFGSEYGTISEDKVIIEKFNGRNSGNAAVIFEDDEKAQDAKEAMNRKEIGDPPRYVILCDD